MLCQPEQLPCCGGHEGLGDDRNLGDRHCGNSHSYTGGVSGNAVFVHHAIAPQVEVGGR